MTSALSGSPRRTAVDLAALVNSAQLRAVDVVAEALEHIDAADTEVRAFRELWPQQALRAAADVDAAVAAGQPLPLAGVPLGVKASEGVDSVQARRLIAAGCIPIGTTSVPRGTPWQTWGHTDRGPTTNPWRADRSPGGSSAGSAAAVAAGLVPLATGNDGAGSLRIPAAWCGIVGMKVTTGLLPARDRAGLNAPGPLARTVADAAAYLGAVLGTEVRTQRPTDAHRPVRALWTATLGYAKTDPGIVVVARAAADRLADAGVIEWVDHDLVLTDPAGAWHALRRGDPAPSDLASRADNNRRLAAAFQVAEVLLTPTAPVSAHGHDGPGETISVSLTWAFNLSGHPAASVPVGLGADGVPIGLQIVVPHRDEATLLRMADAFLSSPGISDLRADRAHTAD
ncbi:amidase family protein [Actinoplanes utahensis]|uniref:amidase family protein n=1 Tax=Actinoplanes utahensis TaxID=1869 RepID=UPI000690421B|nr:amidase [Actinoplanes utahensis]GIF33519.1 amidase [Actinoplanes utahensis]